MADGTGLPIPKSGLVNQPGPQVSGTSSLSQSINADAYSTAQSWRQMAKDGESLSSSAMLVVQQARVGHLAEQDVQIARDKADLRDKHALDPAAFDNAWQAYTEGKLNEAPGWSVPHIKRVLGSEGNSAYSAILGEKRSQDHKLDAQRVDSLIQLTGSDVVAAAAAGTSHTDDGQIKLGKFVSVLDSAVSSRLMAPEKAQLLKEDYLAKAHGEGAARAGVEIYRKEGYGAAIEHLIKTVRDNEGMQTSLEKRYAAFNRGLSAVKLAQREDAGDREGIVISSRDLRARIETNQPYDPAEVRDALGALQRSGAAAEHRALAIAHGVHQQTAGLPVRDLAVAAARARTDTAASRGALQFFIDKGYSRAQAAGIVGNLIQENATFDPAMSHDGGTGIGIAGWRLERRTALQRFAAERGKPEADRQTQLEFIDHELRTTEGAARERLLAATTPEQAAEAFIHFERPQGYTPANPRGGHGFANRVRNAKAVAGEPSDAAGIDGPYAGQITKGVQRALVAAAHKAWPEFKKLIDQGRLIDEEDFNSIRDAAALSGDAKWHQEVEDLATANRIGRSTAGMSPSQKQSLADQARGQLGETVATSLQTQVDRQRKMVSDDPVSYHVEHGGAAPDPLDFSSPQAALAGIGQRVRMARGVAADQQMAPGNPLRPADRASIAGVVTTGKPEQVAVALHALASIPDEMLTPALNAPEIKTALIGAARSSDPARYTATMTFMDRIWSRAPETATQLFGAESVHSLMTWQSNLRYLTPEALAKEREKSALDPQVRERQRQNQQEGLKLARTYDFDKVVSQFDTSWWQPAPLARLTGALPSPPTDPLTRDALMGDFETLFARRYAETLDKDIAATQATELMKTKWTASPVNGGRLMLNAPETLRDRNGNPVYPAVDGSYDWMTRQINAALSAQVGPLGPTFSEAQRRGEAPIPTPLVPAWEYTLVSDRQTAAEAQAGRPASYVVVVRDTTTGRDNPVPRRFAFDPSEAVGANRADFEVQRRRATAPYASIGGELRGIYDPSRQGQQ